MFKSETELLLLISNLDKQELILRKRFNEFKKSMMEQETLLIECSISKERFEEELRILRSKKVNYDLSDDQKDLKRFSKFYESWNKI